MRGRCHPVGAERLKRQIACLRPDFEAKSTEWEIKRVEILGLMRKRDSSFKSTVDAEQELRELEKQIAEIEDRLRKCQREIWIEYNRIRGTETSVGS